MLTINQIKQPEIVAALKKRTGDYAALINEILHLDDERRKIKTDLENTQAELNKLSSSKDNSHAAKGLKEKGKLLKTSLNSLEEKVHNLIVQVPNAPSNLVPNGITPDDNEIVKQVDELPVLDIENKLSHWDLAKKFDLFDMELGVKLTGAGFPVYTGMGARLQRALINYFLDYNIKAGYKEYCPPFMVNKESAFGTGQLPDKEGQMYHATLDDFYLIPTAEVPVTNIYRDTIIPINELPVKMTAYSPCFRREAGSYGAHVRGLNRVHQFDKVEIVELANPAGSYNRLDEMVSHVEKLIQSLNLPYRILRLCGADMGFCSALTYDFEVYSAAQERWLEVSSVSNFETYQTNRMKIRFEDTNGKKQLVHSLNGSSLALPRIVACLLELNQKPHQIVLPDVLHAYMGTNEIKIGN